MKLILIVSMSPVTADKLVPVTIPVNATFLVPDVSKNNSNCASAGSSAVKTSFTNF